jgi:uncharacterized protein YbbK (DUF523 family)
MIIVSACLAGINCKYNGKSNLNKEIAQMVTNGEAIPVCPEQLGGCTTPRPASEINGGTGADVLDGKCRVKRITGEDITDELIRGAQETLKLAELVNAKKAVLKSKSPSCGCGMVYDGTFSGKLIEGNGVTSELLLRNGIEVKTELD